MFYTEYEISLMPEEPTANTAAANSRSPSWSLLNNQQAGGRGPSTPAAPSYQTRPPAKRQGEKRAQRILNSASLLSCKYSQLCQSILSCKYSQLCQSILSYKYSQHCQSTQL